VYNGKQSARNNGNHKQACKSIVICYARPLSVYNAWETGKMTSLPPLSSPLSFIFSVLPVRLFLCVSQSSSIDRCKGEVP
jgi:hypothetical protein